MYPPGGKAWASVPGATSARSIDQRLKVAAMPPMTAEFYHHLRPNTTTRLATPTRRSRTLETPHQQARHLRVPQHWQRDLPPCD